MDRADPGIGFAGIVSPTWQPEGKVSFIYIAM